MSAFAPARSSRSIASLVLAGLMVAGCRGQAPTATAATPLASHAPAQATEPQPARTMTALTGTLWAPTASPRPVRTKLEATDPRTVSLANGTPTLVEFFAFW